MVFGAVRKLAPPERRLLRRRQISLAVSPLGAMGARLPEPTEGPASCKVWDIKTLGRTDDARAREMLEKTAWQVQPIMRKRGWKVAELCEMKPEQRDRVGDNLNMGQRVRLKLRKNNKGDWFDYEHVVLVMLHELVHNDIGPHNAKFFKLLDEVTVECETLMASGIGGSGAGFDAKGTKLGHRGGWGGIETRDPTKAAADAAAKRAGYQNAMGPAGGRRLGGGVKPPAGPREAAAAAAERRLRAEQFAKEHGLMNDVVVIDDDDDDDDENEVGEGGEGGGRGRGKKDGKKFAAPSLLRFGRVKCPCCDAFRCEKPGGNTPGDTGDDDEDVVVLSIPVEGGKTRGKRKRPSAENKSKNSPALDDDDDVIIIDEVSPPPKTRSKVKGVEPRWTCSQCTLVNPESATHCAACERWRFGRGAPAASRPTGADHT